MVKPLIVVAAALLAAPAFAQEFSGPPAAKRGYEIFHNAEKASSCGNCHALGGKGLAVGPDLSRLARLNPRGIKIAILATRTQYVQSVKLKSGETFTGMEKSKEGDTIEYYDLGKQPPELRKFAKADIASTQDNASWKHPAEGGGYSAQQLADIMSYIRFASYGDTKGVSPEDIE